MPNNIIKYERDGGCGCGTIVIIIMLLYIIHLMGGC